MYLLTIVLLSIAYLFSRWIIFTFVEIKANFHLIHYNKLMDIIYWTSKKQFLKIHLGAAQYTFTCCGKDPHKWPHSYGRGASQISKALCHHSWHIHMTVTIRPLPPTLKTIPGWFPPHNPYSYCALCLKSWPPDLHITATFPSLGSQLSTSLPQEARPGCRSWISTLGGPGCKQ